MRQVSGHSCWMRSACVHLCAIASCVVTLSSANFLRGPQPMSVRALGGQRLGGARTICGGHLRPFSFDLLRGSGAAVVADSLPSSSGCSSSSSPSDRSSSAASSPSDASSAASSWSDCSSSASSWSDRELVLPLRRRFAFGCDGSAPLHRRFLRGRDLRRGGSVSSGGLRNNRKRACAA